MYLIRFCDVGDFWAVSIFHANSEPHNFEFLRFLGRLEFSNDVCAARNSTSPTISNFFTYSVYLLLVISSSFARGLILKYNQIELCLGDYLFIKTVSLIIDQDKAFLRIGQHESGCRTARSATSQGNFNSL